MICITIRMRSRRCTKVIGKSKLDVNLGRAGESWPESAKFWVLNNNLHKRWDTAASATATPASALGETRLLKCLRFKAFYLVRLISEETVHKGASSNTQTSLTKDLSFSRSNYNYFYFLIPYKEVLFLQNFEVSEV